MNFINVWFSFFASFAEFDLFILSKIGIELLLLVGKSYTNFNSFLTIVLSFVGRY